MKKRINELDGLRGIAALMVVLFHYTRRYSQECNYLGEVSPAMDFLRLGVPLFFMVSGFVILMTLERCKKPLDFAVSRFARLYPAYWAGILCTTLGVFLLGLNDRAVSWTDWFCNFSMLQGFLPGLRHVDGVYWTLTIELVFYFWMFILFSCGGLKHVEWAGLAWMIIASVYGLGALYFGRVGILETLLILPYCNLFVAGTCLYLIYSDRSSRITYAVLSFSSVMNYAIWEKVDFLVISSFYLVFLAVVRHGIPLLRARVLLFLGMISYPLYLVHQNIGYGLMNCLFGRGYPLAVVLPITILASMTLAALIWYTVERPARRAIRERYAIIQGRDTPRRNAIREVRKGRSRAVLANHRRSQDRRVTTR